MVTKIFKEVNKKKYQLTKGSLNFKKLKNIQSFRWLFLQKEQKKATKYKTSKICSIDKNYSDILFFKEKNLESYISPNYLAAPFMCLFQNFRDQIYKQHNQIRTFLLTCYDSRCNAFQMSPDKQLISSLSKDQMIRKTLIISFPDSILFLDIFLIPNHTRGRKHRLQARKVWKALGSLTACQKSSLCCKTE